MDDTLVETIAQLLRERIGLAHARETAAGRFEEVLEEIRDALGPGVLGGIPERELRCVVAMLIHGPDHSGTPPCALREDLLKVLDDLDAPDAHVEECVIAFGAGWRRQISPTHWSGWAAHWPNAFQALQKRFVRPPVKEVTRWLRHVACLDDLLSEKDWRDEERYATGKLTTSLMVPGAEREGGFSIRCGHAEDDVQVVWSSPDGEESRSVPAAGRYVFTPARTLSVEVSETVPETMAGRAEPGKAFDVPAGIRVVLAVDDDSTCLRLHHGAGASEERLLPTQGADFAPEPHKLSVWSCTCGLKHCLAEHRLVSWGPRGGKKATAWLSLAAFVAQAIHGARKKRGLQSKAIAAGMYLAYLAARPEAPRFRMARVEVAICHHCSTPYERDLCPKEECGKEFDRALTRRIVGNRIIGVPSVGLPLYRRAARDRCESFAEHWQAVERYHGRSGPEPEVKLNGDKWHNLFPAHPPELEILEAELEESRAVTVAELETARTKVGQEGDSSLTAEELQARRQEVEAQLDERIQKLRVGPSPCPICGRRDGVSNNTRTNVWVQQRNTRQIPFDTLEEPEDPEEEES
jgi:hypothetical protein